MRPSPYREVKRKLEAAGFVQVGQTGSHVKFAKTTTTGTLTATVPKHSEVALARYEVSCVKRDSANTSSSVYEKS
jgi:predicted RNA binding protein YcfA (HicA-like mRNA interferase family)